MAFAEAQGWTDPYMMPNLSQLFDFVAFYAAWYRDGAGASAPDASRRATNAARARFNLEIKRDPTAEEQTADRRTFVRVVGEVVLSAGLVDRVDIQSFDHATLHAVHDEFPQLRTAFLVADDTLRVDTDGRSPWLANLPWPWRVTMDSHPVRVAQSGGLEGLALSSDGRRLLPMLEKPLIGDAARTLRIFEYDLEEGSFTGTTWRFGQHLGATAIGDFLMVDERRGLVIERDDAEGELDALKVITEIELGSSELTVTRTLVDLMALDDPSELSLPASEGDVGLGHPFAFPFFTIECLAILDSRRLLVANDNNYPFSVGRHVGSERPDDNEIIVIELPNDLY